jgi:glycerol-3-phosphate dehydrogenase
MATKLALDQSSIAELAIEHWDLLVIGGGITGVGIFREASRCGLRALLVEQADFASGTSSNSAKLIHGGLHYLRRLQIGVTFSSVRARDRLLQSGAGLIEPIDFLLPFHDADRRKALAASFGLSVYDAMSGRFHRPVHVPADRLIMTAPGIDRSFVEALRYTDAQTDDVRLTLRVLAEGRRNGGVARNYVEVTELMRDHHGTIVGAEIHDKIADQTAIIRARNVVNAAGPWASAFQASRKRRHGLRLIRGSHLIFPHAVLPVSTAIATEHVESELPLYFIPWRGVTIVGTTHIDMGDSIMGPARASDHEIDYLLRGTQAVFPDRCITHAEIQATFSGYRPIVDRGRGEPSEASRDFAIRDEDGLITVMGGKLTTFHTMARQALRKMTPRTERSLAHSLQRPPLDEVEIANDRRDDERLFDSVRLTAWYGADAMLAFHEMPASEHLPLCEHGGTTPAQIRWSARSEDIQHLDDLLLRRTRLGLLTRDGGLGLLEHVKPIVQAELGWSDMRWRLEVDDYRHHWELNHGVTPASSGRNSQISV